MKRLSDVTTSPGVVKGSPPLTASASERKSEILEALEKAANEDEVKKAMSAPRKSSLRSPIDVRTRLEKNFVQSCLLVLVSLADSEGEKVGQFQ